MNWFLNGIFLLTCYPIVFLMYFMLRKVYDKSGYCFGATLKKELREDEEVKQIIAEFQKKFKKVMTILAIVILPVVFVPSLAIGFTLWMLWILIICFYPWLLMAKGNRQIRELKQKKGWDEDHDASNLKLEMPSLPNEVKFTSFLPTLLFSTIPAILGWAVYPGEGYEAYAWMVVTFGLLTYVFYLSAIWTDRQKIMMISESAEVNRAFSKAKKETWKTFWQRCCWLNGVFTWVTLLFVWQRSWAIMGLLWCSVIYGLLLIVLCYRLLVQLNKINDTFESKRTLMDEADDDKYWIYGMFYYNKNDKHIMVENRMGTGTTMNLASGFVKGMYVFAAITMLMIPVMCGWMMMLEFTPIHTTIEDDVIVCEHLSVEYEIPLENIKEYTVLTELPDMVKVTGNGMENVCSGTFDVYREGKFEAFLNPQNTLFVRIVTEDETYLISGVEDAQTQELISEIENYK